MNEVVARDAERDRRMVRRKRHPVAVERRSVEQPERIARMDRPVVDQQTFDVDAMVGAASVELSGADVDDALWSADEDVAVARDVEPVFADVR